MKKFMTLAVAMVLFLGLGMFNTAAATTITTLSGDYYIPQGANPQGFATLAEAITALNTNGASGTVKFLIDGNLAEVGANLIITRADLNATNNLVIKPATAKTDTITISGCTATAGANQYAGLTISGASYVTIDGSNSEGGTTKDLTILMSDGTNGRIIVELYGNTDNITVKNTNFQFKTPMSTANTSTVIYINGQTSGVADNLTIENNVMGNSTNIPFYAVRVTGSSTAPSTYCSNIIVKNNDLTAQMRTVYFYVVGAAGTTSEISGNIISNPSTTITGYVVYGIMANTYGGTINIFNNRIVLKKTNNATSQGLHGISTLTAQAGNVVNIYNNFIGDFYCLNATGNTTPVTGIYTQDAINANIYHNTIYMNPVNNTTGIVAGLRFGSAGVYDVKNNVIINTYDAVASYGVYKKLGTLTSDYNDIYLSGSNAKAGYWTSADVTTFADWQTASGQDVHSVSKAVEFTSAADLHLAGASIGDNSLYSLPIASVEKDIDGDVRSVYFPYKGADEAATPLIGTPPNVFFSEYIEGSSNNKAIEIFNGTNETIDLSKYVVKASNNGLGWGVTTTGADTRYVLPLSGTLAAGDVYVVYNSAAVTAISSVGDIGFAYNGTVNGGNGDNVPTFNGNDAVGLFYGNLLSDAIGAETQTANFNVAGVTGAAADHTLIRKPTVTSGNTNWTTSAGTNADDSEWIVKAKDTFGYLGSHNAKPEFTDLKLWSGTDQATWASVTYDVAAGFSMDLNPTIEYYYLTFDTLTATSVPMTPGYYGFTVATHPIGFMDYWAARGVVSGASGWQAIAWEIINGNQPTFYVKVGTDGSLRLVDGLQRLAGATDDPYLRINGNYLEGAYTYTGKVTSEFGIESDAITIGITFATVKPQFTNIVLGSSTDQASWSNVAGDIVNGFSTTIDPAIDWYYLNLLTGTTTNEPLKEGYYGFKVATYPAGFFEYWNGRGVNASDATATGDTAWQKIAWDIINAVEPTFYLKVASDASLKLVDGLQKLAGAMDDPYLRIEGDYLPGGYSYTGTVTGSSNVESDPVSIAITFKEKSDILTVAQLQDTTGAAIVGDSKLKGQWIKTIGIVTAVGSNCFWLQDAPGGWNGIYAYTKTAPAVVLGDSVLVVGKMAEYYNLTEIDSVTTTVLASGCVVPAPTVVTAAEFVQEKYEGVLVTVNNVTCTNPSLGNGEWEITDASGKTRVNDKLFLSVGKLSWVYNVTGVSNYDFSNFKIEPRNAADVVVVSSPSSRFLWEKDISSYPFFKNDHFTRGMAYNPVTNHLIVASRTGAANLWILNAANGDTVGRMNMTGVAGGTYAINIPRVDKDGVIYLCNLTTGGTTPFKLYRWANETAVPTVAYENAAPAARTGDIITLVGSGVNTIIYASGSTSTRIEVLTTADGLTFTAGTPITVAAGLARGGISPVGDGTFWVNGAGTSTTHISATGTVLNAISGGLVDGGWHTVMYLHVPFTKKVVAVAGKNNAFRGNQVQVWNVNESEVNPTLVDTVNTTSGYNANTNACADLTYKLNTDGTATIYELITNNTIAAWTLTLPIDIPSLTIAEAKVDADGDFRPDLLNKIVKVKGVNTTTNLEIGYANRLGYYIQDATGGINIYKSGYAMALAIGDEVEVTGTVSFYSGLTEIIPLPDTTIDIISTGNVIEPRVLTIAEVMEPIEGILIRLDNVRMVEPYTGWTPGLNANLFITDGLDTLTMRIDKDTDADEFVMPSGANFSVIGVACQFTSSTPPNNGYQIIPISKEHIIINVPKPEPKALLPFWSKSVNSGNNLP